MLLHRETLARGNMRVCQLRVELQRAGACVVGVLKFRAASAPVKEVHVGGCEASPSGSKMRIEFDRSLEHLSGKLDALACPPLEEFPRTKIKLICLDVFRRRFKETALLSLGE